MRLELLRNELFAERKPTFISKISKHLHHFLRYMERKTIQSARYHDLMLFAFDLTAFCNLAYI